MQLNSFRFPDTANSYVTIAPTTSYVVFVDIARAGNVDYIRLPVKLCPQHRGSFKMTATKDVAFVRAE